MNPVVTLKRTLEVDLKLCTYCQKRNKPKDNVREAKNHNKIVVYESTTKRRKYRDVADREVIDRLEDLLGRNGNLCIVWHVNCYAQFTSKEKIQRLQQKEVISEELRHAITATNTSPRKTRSHAEKVNWSKCKFCQDENPKERLSSVMTLKMSEQIIEAAQFNYKLRVRLAGVCVCVCDFIATEAKHHLPCLSAFKRSLEKARLETKDSDLAMIWLCEELEYAADKGYVIKCNDAWNRCMALAEKAEIEIPRSFISRRSTFKDKLLLRLKNVMDCVQPLETSPSERLTLLIPTKFANIAVSKLANEKADTDDLLPMPTYEPHEDILLSLVHVALQIRGDIMEKPGLKGLVLMSRMPLIVFQTVCTRSYDSYFFIFFLFFFLIYAYLLKHTNKDFTIQFTIK